VLFYLFIVSLRVKPNNSIVVNTINSRDTDAIMNLFRFTVQDHRDLNLKITLDDGLSVWAGFDVHSHTLSGSKERANRRPYVFCVAAQWRGY